MLELASVGTTPRRIVVAGVPLRHAVLHSKTTASSRLDTTLVAHQVRQLTLQVDIVA